jgi:LmbE family N-acetylglucosaminyl deacetylase
MIKLRAELDPDIVVMPSTHDTHQDHEVINREAFRAFKRSTLLGYEIPWNNRHTDLTFYNRVTKGQVDVKIKSIASYQSQLFRAPNYAELVSSLAIQRGNQVGLEYAEAFEVIRWVEN